MVVGVPLLEGRVAPRCTQASHLLLATLSRGRVTSRRVVPATVDSAVTLLELARSHGIGTLVCGGITLEDRTLVLTDGIDVVDNVACSVAEAVTAIDNGTLQRGFGLENGCPPGGREGGADPVEGPGVELQTTWPDCLACDDRVCLRGRGCSLAPDPELHRGLGSPEIRRVLEAAADVSFEHDRQLCRLSELVYFCLEMEYKKVGLAFCIDLLEPTQILAGVLRRFTEVVSVCCKVGGAETADPGELEPERGRGRRPAVDCNPLAQAQVLNEAGTDLNVLVGLCVGVDTVFTSASRAPVTALFVKDRSLANNPIGAVYSEYYLQECAAPDRERQPGGSQDRATRTGIERLAWEER